MAGPSVGLDVGGTKVLGVLLDESGTVLGSLRLPTSLGRDGVVDSAALAVHRLCAGARVEPAELVGVGLGVPGAVDTVTGEVSYAVNLRIDDAGVPLGRLVADRLGVPVAVENDLNAAAFGAARVLGLSGDLAVLALGTGTAAGLLLDGRLRRGRSGAAGEIGHLTYRQDGPACPCGQRGCLELYASGSALHAAWPVPAGRHAPAEVFAAASRGEQRAIEVRDRFADAVAHAVRTLVLTCDVEHVLLAGGVAEVGTPLLESARAAVLRHVEGSPFLRSLGMADRLRLLGSDSLAAPIGAALLAAEDLAVVGPPTTEERLWRS